VPKKQRIVGQGWAQCDHCHKVRGAGYVLLFEHGLLLTTDQGLCTTEVPTRLCRHCAADIAHQHGGVLLEWRPLRVLDAAMPRPWSPGAAD
jgi:hypothetical protein